MQNIRGVSIHGSPSLCKYCSKCFAKYETIPFSTLTQRVFDYYHVYFEDGELRGSSLGNATVSGKARTKL